MQSLVRIYNRHHLLTWFQDIESSIFGRLFQVGRNRWGTAGMGGNGQYNRLAALASIDTAQQPDEDRQIASRGPWRDRLTEDQDLGLRLMVAGWSCRQDNRASIEQVAYLLMPVFQSIVGASLIGAAYLAVTGTTVFGGSLWWLLWPVLVRSVGRQLVGMEAWAKTGREQLDAPAGDRSNKLES